MKKKYLKIGGIAALVIYAVCVTAIIVKEKIEEKIGEASIGITGEADGPTSYYIKFGDIVIPMVIIGLAIIILCIIIFKK